MVVCAAIGGLAYWAQQQGKFDAAAFFSKAVPVSKPDKKPVTAGQSGGRRDGGRPVPVEVASARNAQSARDIRAIGSLQSDESVVLAPEIAGRVTEIAFTEGGAVKSGAVLVKLDDSLTKAEVADADARLKLAQSNRERARSLAKSGAGTGRGRDEAESAYETSVAALELAKTRLDKMLLRAPFNGVAGLRGISAGAFVSAGTPIANLEKIDVLKLDFKVPEIHLREIEVGQPVEVRVDAIADRVFEGAIYAINPLVDVNGRALQVRARIDNKDGSLRPGLFARVVIKGLKPLEVVLIPEAAVVPRGEEAIVYVVEDNRAVEKRVLLGQRSNGEVEVNQGFTAPATVITAGQYKLRNGTQVEVIPTGQAPAASGGEAPRRNTSGASG